MEPPVRIRRLWCALAAVLVFSVTVTGEQTPPRSSSVSALYAWEDDPLGEKDTFATLPAHVKKAWSREEHPGAGAKRKRLLDLEAATVIDVKLVGFDADGAGGLTLKESDLSKYLETLRSDGHVQVLYGEENELAVRTKLRFHVSKPASGLASSIHAQVASHVPALNATGLAPLSAVPHMAVDELVAADFSTYEASYAVYILNPLKQRHAYAYGYGGGGGAGAEGGGGGVGCRCLGTSYSGTGRYTWVDLTAGPVSYGPAAHGDGLVTNATFVTPRSFASNMHGVLLAHLASLVASAARHLIAPAVYHHPLAFARSTEVRVVHLQGSAQAHGHVGGGGGGDPPGGGGGFDLGAVEAKMKAAPDGHGLLLPKQEIVFATSALPLARCAFCAAAYSRALRTYTRGELGPGGALRAGQYLDSEELHHLFTEFWPEIKAAAEIQDAPFLQPGAAAPGRMIPIFLLDIDGEQPVLLDRTEQAVAYHDMVIAVRTRGANFSSGFMCNGEDIEVDPSDVTRPVLAALLESGWGVSPTHMSWSAVRNRTEVDYRWLVGRTPFGPLACGAGLSYAQRDAARRGVLYSLLHERVVDALSVLDAIEAYGGERVVLHSPAARAEYTQRWNVLLHKLRKGCDDLSLLNHASALYCLEAAGHDVRALNGIVRLAAHELQTVFTCYQEPRTQFLWYASVLLTGLGVICLWTRRESWLGLKSKSKRF